MISDDINRLLARGGRILGLAALAHASGPCSSGKRWHVLSPETAAAADQILSVIEGGVEPLSLAAALGAAMGEGPATSCPGWVLPVIEDPGLIDLIGREVPPRVGLAPSEGEGNSERIAGLASLGMALCRSLDAVMAVAERLEREDGEALVRLSRLAQAEARPNEPSEVRAMIRRLIEGAHG